MPSTVTRVIVKNGDQVKKGDLLLVVEAMKMEVGTMMIDGWWLMSSTRLLLQRMVWSRWERFQRGNFSRQDSKCFVWFNFRETWNMNEWDDYSSYKQYWSLFFCISLKQTKSTVQYTTHKHKQPIATRQLLRFIRWPFLECQTDIPLKYRTFAFLSINFINTYTYI